MTYCNCANQHKPGGLPPLRIEDDKRKGSGEGKRRPT